MATESAHQKPSPPPQPTAGQEQQKLIALGEKYRSLCWEIDSIIKGLALEDRAFVLANCAVHSFGTGDGAQTNAAQFEKTVQGLMKMQEHA